MFNCISYLHDIIKIKMNATFFKKKLRKKALQGVTIFGIYFQFLLKTQNSLRSNSHNFLTKKSK
jgi:hypothetical protein